MRYRFITIMHNMKLTNVKNKGMTVFDGARISNGNEVLDQTIGIEPMKYTLGVHSSDEFRDKTYAYIDGSLDDISSMDEMNEIGSQYTFYLLRQMQGFTNELWKLKDNNVYVRDGFLLVYDKRMEDGFTYKASVSSVYGYSTNETNESLFSDCEIAKVICKFKYSSFEENIDYKIPVSDIFIKSKGAERLDRAHYFVLSARNSSILPMKIVFYVNSLECLFTIGSQEVTHKVSERIAILLGDTSEERKRLFNIIKTAYGVRSKLVHGQYIKRVDEDLIDISKSLDHILRILLNKRKCIFEMKDNKMEEYFLDLIFDYIK